MVSLPDHKRAKKLKVDSPVLGRGKVNELDVRDFGKRGLQRQRQDLDLEGLRRNIPFEGIDEGKGEGLMLSDGQNELPGLWWGRVKGEKLVASKEAAGLLQDVLRGVGGEEEEEEEMVKGNKKVGFLKGEAWVSCGADYLQIL